MSRTTYYLEILTLAINSLIDVWIELRPNVDIPFHNQYIHKYIFSKYSLYFSRLRKQGKDVGTFKSMMIKESKSITIHNWFKSMHISILYFKSKSKSIVHGRTNPNSIFISIKIFALDICVKMRFQYYFFVKRIMEFSQG